MSVLKTSRKSLIWVAAVVLLACPTAMSQTTCGDVTGDEWASIHDLVLIYYYLWLDSMELEPFIDPLAVEGLDGVSGITNNDLSAMQYAFFTAIEPLSCEITSEAYANSEDTLRFVNVAVPPGNDTWEVEVWVNILGPYFAISSAFSYGCTTSDIVLEDIVFHVEREAWQGYLVDTEAQLVAFGTNDLFPKEMPGGYCHLATLRFSLTPSLEQQIIDIELAEYPLPITNHVTVISKETNGALVGTVPELRTFETDPDCDLYGHQCFGGTRGNIDGGLDFVVDIGDLTALINHLFISVTTPEAFGEADVSPDGVLDIGDVTVFVDHLFISQKPLVPCSAGRTAAAKAAARTDLGSLQTSYASGATTITLNTTEELRGLQLTLTGTGSDEVTSLASDKLDLLVGRRDNTIVIGLVDLTGQEMIAVGETDLLSLDGHYTVLSAVASDMSHNSVQLNTVNEYTAEVLPDRFELSQNYPNPFNPATEMRFTIPTASQVSLEIYNLLGQKVATLVNGYLPAGNHAERWDATGQASGIYLYRLQVGDYTETKKMLLMK